ncbi:MAG: hypothetical protein COV31_01110 [Candidatus Yanofskybacteria bacterium CG10_big_fil_rev_8_21_14_0_10_46_23]|uniref:Lipid/polyisoprenoid-binding YceI-like domain-containing protein n=1 Tax=Candidatus Yanofskybacteria bacterium CG10_big_fil_rev_8_21_14_0_10_46_23 TaxID=1975098 RepID=A0A2H0R552_9BACT|nr:MAG: hypothetical protein COV31_01110 [Candidatus Yanofskybacteria bacterium CG10_big_fil_rev_8_21_14_0_10_46_23]
MKKIGLILVVIAILILAFIFFRNSGPTNNLDQFEQSAENLPVIPEGQYKVDSELTRLRWQGSRIDGSTHFGFVTVSGGEVEVKEGKAEGEFNIDMTTISESKNTEMFLLDIRGEDFFAVDRFPTAKIKINIDSEMDRGPEAYTVRGELTIRDKTNPISFPARIHRDGNNLVADASFLIDRTEWDIIFDSGSFFTNLGDRAIHDNIQFELHLILN